MAEAERGRAEAYKLLAEERAKQQQLVVRPKEDKVGKGEVKSKFVYL